MKPFNLEAALQGAECVTRCGYPAFVKYRDDIFGDACLVGYFILNNGKAVPCRWDENGRYDLDVGTYNQDLFMPNQTRIVWFNLYASSLTSAFYQIFDTKQEADSVACGRERIGNCAHRLEIEE